jgi:hypothetical protein
MTPVASEQGAPSGKPRKAGWLALLVLIGTGSYFIGKRAHVEQPPPTSVTVEQPMPSVVLAVQSLARLQSVAFHMERVVDLTKKEQALWGLVETEDNILLVAVGDVEAGVDLGKLQKGDVTVDETKKSVRVVLPPVELFAARLDNERTYVHSRRTDVLGKKDVQLETEARQRAERSIRDGALEAGILKLAEESAINTVRSLVQSLGYQVVIVEMQRE